jgi:CubicO group peptidase (beta-lactamase class C family)
MTTVPLLLPILIAQNVVNPTDWQPKFKAAGANSVSIATIKNGQLDQTQSIGDPNHQAFQVGFLSRLPLLIITFQLVDSKQLDLDQKVSFYQKTFPLPNNPFESTNPLLVRHLLTGLSGNKQYKYFGYPTSQNIPPRNEILKRFIISNAPGTKQSNSAPDILLLQAIVEDITGQTIESLAEIRVFKPLSLTNSSYFEPKNPNLIAPGEIKRRYYPESSAQGLWSNAADIAAMYAAMIQAYQDKPSLISKSSADLLFSIHTGQSTHGLNRRNLDNSFEIFLGGQCDGYSGNSTLRPLDGAGVVLLTNGNMAWSAISPAITEALAKILNPISSR